MPKIYTSGTKLPESNATVSGGLAIELHDPADIDGVIAICALAPQPPEAPMASVYRVFSDPSLDISAWATHWRDLESLRPTSLRITAPPQSTNYKQTDSHEDEVPFPDTLIGKLRMALTLAKDLWQSQGDETLLLSLIVLIAEPVGKETTELHLDGDGAALVIRPGSLIVEVQPFPLRAATFAVCLVVGGGTSTSARRTGMVARLRIDAEARGGRSLKDIRELVPSDPEEFLAVLIHGLFATDVGTFGTLQERLEQSFEVVGFPHDTLSESIEANGRELAQRLYSLRQNYSKIVLIAHSRGGLVARSAAVQLKDRGDRPSLRCVTFGTPHLGAEMAENPGSLIASIVLLKGGLIDKSVASIVDILCCVSELGNLPGISDLRPASTPGTWLAKLQAEEGLFPDNLMKLCVVGGAKRAVGLKQKIANFAVRRVMGDKDSDLVVALSSSLPLLNGDNALHLEVNCDHFSYFEKDQNDTKSQKGIFDQVVSFLRGVDKAPGAGKTLTKRSMPVTSKTLAKRPRRSKIKDLLD